MSEFHTTRDHEAFQRISTSLSVRQRDVFLGSDGRLQADLLVAACPGAGKTTSVAARAAYQIALQNPVALTTYTNVAADELAASLESKFSATIPPDCFIGTLHKFLVTYVLHPFQALLFQGSPLFCVRVGDSGKVYSYCTTYETRYGWKTKEIQFPRDDFAFAPNGDLVFSGSVPKICDISAEEIVIMFRDQVRRDKSEEWSRGGRHRE